MSLVGYRNRIFVFFSWMWSYFSYDRSNRLIIGEQGKNLYFTKKDEEEQTTNV
jgi:NADH dehydrogenase